MQRTELDTWRCASCATADWRLRSTIDRDVCVRCHSEGALREFEATREAMLATARRRGYWEGVIVFLVSFMVGLLLSFLVRGGG